MKFHFKITLFQVNFKNISLDIQNWEIYLDSAYLNFLEIYFYLTFYRLQYLYFRTVIAQLTY